MHYRTSIGYHDAFFEVEIMVSQSANTKKEAEKIGNDDELTGAVLHEDKLVVGRGEKQFVVDRKEMERYQFRICALTEEELHQKGHHVSSDDYEDKTWDEAMDYFHATYQNSQLPFPLESYYYAVVEEKEKSRG